VKHSQTNSQVLSADGETLFRLVNINGIPCWQAQTGRTFPVIAGAEDPPPGDSKGDEGKGDPPGKKPEGSADGDDGDFDKDRALATIRKLRELEKTSKAERQELDALRKKVKESEDAQKSEAERLKEQLAEATRKADDTARELQETRNRQAIERAAVKAGAADPDDVFRLLDPSEFERDDEGKLTNADKLVETLLKAKPYLKGKEEGQTHARGNGAGPKPTGSSATYAEVVKAEEKRLKQSGAINI